MLKEKILSGKTYLGIELGSTRIKASLIDDTFTPIASGGFGWENQFEDGYWTYSLDIIHRGVKECFEDLKKDVFEKYEVSLSKVDAIGISAMMHGYLAFDKDDNLLAPFRTWRNTTTEQAATILSDLFHFCVPQRWSIAHLYQAILNGEEHVGKIAHITTLSGYIHYLLTGKWELGIGDASGMFPIKDNDYDQDMLEKFRNLVADKNFGWDIANILPKVKIAGEKGTVLTEQGAKFLDKSGKLLAGIPLCAPEGDAGTGMVATNTVLPKTGNISAGTSIFAMLVLEKPLSDIHPQIDIVTTPYGSPVAMVHCNNCSSELDAWVRIFGEFANLIGAPVEKSALYDALYNHTLSADADCGGVLACNYLSGEHITEIANGRPMYFRLPDGKMNLANFMKAQVYSAFATLRIGMGVLFDEENVGADEFLAHGGLFKTKGIAQQILADALKTPVSVMSTAGEGGAWGMALLAGYMINGEGKSLGQWLKSEVFSKMEIWALKPDLNGSQGFERFLQDYKDGLCAQKSLEQVK